MSRTIAFFDFDGTITTKDTMLELVRFHKGDMAFYSGMLLLSPYLIAMKLKLLSRKKAKEKLLSFFFGNLSAEKFDNICNDFNEKKISSLIRPAALSAITQHQQKGTEVVVVSASAGNWINTWCSRNNIQVIATQLEVKDGVITGRLNGANCHGEEKVKRIKEIYTLPDYNEIYCYGDTKGDKPMLKLATFSFYKPFRD